MPNNKLAREQRVNRNLTVVVVCMTIVILGLIYLVINVSRPVTVEILPEIDSVQTVKSGETQKHNIYGLASLVFLGINTWEEDGDKEYLDNIKRYLQFIDSDFREWLISDYSFKKDGGNINELDGRTKEIRFTEQFYTPDKVKTAGNGTWSVEMELEIKEKIGSLVIKHYTGTFEIYVSKQRAKKEVNPWQLKLSGKPIEIKRIKTFQ